MTNSLTTPPAPSGNELSTAGAMSGAVAEIQAKFTIAMARPRDLDVVKTRLLAACHSPKFASEAIYSKKKAGTMIEGPSIRFAEETIRLMGNMDVVSTITFEDAEKRMLKVSVIDLETNTSYGDEVSISKTIERQEKQLYGREFLRERTNSEGKTVYICPCTDDELREKTESAKSKVIRNSGLRVVPAHLVEEALEACRQTTKLAGSNPALVVLKKFSDIGVNHAALQVYLGHDPRQMGEGEIEVLRQAYKQIANGNATWAQFVAKGGDNDGGE